MHQTSAGNSFIAVDLPKNLEDVINQETTSLILQTIFCCSISSTIVKIDCLIFSALVVIVPISRFLALFLVSLESAFLYKVIKSGRGRITPYKTTTPKPKEPNGKSKKTTPTTR